MRIRYITVFVLTISLVLCACSKNVTQTGKKSETMTTKGELQNEQTATSNNTSNSNTLHHLDFNYKTNCLILSDCKTNSVLNKITFEKNSFASEIFNFETGYVVEVSYSDKPVNISSGGIVSYPQKITEKCLRIYDEKLNLLKDINLSKILPGDLSKEYLQCTISSDGNEIAWLKDQELYIFDRRTGQTSKILDNASNNVNFEKVCFSRDNHQIVFYGSRANDNEGDMCYGLLELETKKMTIYVKKQYQGDDLNVAGRYACITDVLDPRVKTSSGKVVILDLQTKETFTMQVDGSESSKAIITEDSKYLLAAKKGTDGSYRIRQYSIKTGVVVNEKTYKPENKGRLIGIFAVNPSTYNFLIYTEANKYLYYTFVCEEK